MIYKIFKVLIGLVIIFPFFQGTLIMLFLLSGEITEFMKSPNYEFTSIYKIMEDLMAPTVFAVLLAMLINLFYLYKSGKISIEKRRLWSGLIVVGNVCTAPFFWYWYIWKEKDN
nr:hypothetical protein [uncultured Desulfobacter sp.]